MGATMTYVDTDTLREFSRRSNLMGFWLIFHAWAVIILSAAVFIVWPNAFTFLLAYCLIGSRQLGLAILMHDAAHGILFKNKTLNDFLGHYFLALSFGGNLFDYRKYHLKHHKYTQRPEDPDLALAAKFPISKLSLTRKFLRDIVGWTAIRLRLGQVISNRKAKKNMETGSDVLSPTAIWPTIVFNLLMLAILTYFGLWWVYFALWLFPLMTWFQVVLRLRNIAEHALTTTDDNPLTHARTTKTNWFTRIFFAPYWVNYHVEHHAYMHVPCYRLPALHKDMLVRGHGRRMEIQPGYLSVLSLATR